MSDDKVKAWDNQRSSVKPYKRWNGGDVDLWKDSGRMIKAVLHFDYLPVGKKGDVVDVLKMWRVQDKHFTNGFVATISRNGRTCFANCYALHSFASAKHLK